MEMAKPYDGQALIEGLKKEGIEGGLETAKKCVVVLADFLRTSAMMSTEGLVGKLDDFAVPGINYFEKLGVAKLDSLMAEMVKAPEVEAAPALEAAPAPAGEEPSA